MPSNPPPRPALGPLADPPPPPAPPPLADGPAERTRKKDKKAKKKDRAGKDR
ncbi:MAG TPA: hypothetical protein VKP11_03985 [Frankiaceae bacterium]|nr:hypothetical protein [Frankiaceae bacterium]